MARQHLIDGQLVAYTNDEEMARDAEEAAVANIFKLNNGVGGSEITTGKVSGTANGTDTIVLEVEKIDRVSKSGVAHDSEVIKCCPMGGGLKLDSMEKTMSGDPGTVSFTFTSQLDIRGTWEVEICSDSLGRRILQVEWS